MTETILYLASASPRRHEILNQLQIPHHILRLPEPGGEDEPRLPDEAPEDYVRRTAHEKVLRAACLLSRDHPDAADFYILGADTTVVLDGHILGKPADRADAARTLKRLSGNVHQVHTALAVHHGDQVFEALSVSTVHFKTLGDAEIDMYCAGTEPMGKAGAYGIQGSAAAFISHLSGSYTGVMGLPAYETCELLAMAGYDRT